MMTDVSYALRDLALRYPVGFGVILTSLRFGIIWAGIALAPLFGIKGWFIGLFVNLVCCLFALGLVAAWGWWKEAGIRASWSARWAVIPLLLVALSWAAPGLTDLEPGWGWWAITLLLVGINEEIFNRGLILHALAQRHSLLVAAGIAASIFGLQHLSALSTSGAPLDEVLWNCLFAGLWGFAVAAVRLRSHWLIPLIVIHALEDFTQILSPGAAPEAWSIGATVLLVVYGFWLLSPKKTTGSVKLT